MTNKVFIGWDSREDIAYHVCRHSIITRASIPTDIQPLKLNQLREQKIIWREKDPKASTEFTFTRFLVPYLSNYRGWSLFIDCDFLFLHDIAELFKLADDSKAIMVVQHDYQPKESVKMDNQAQEIYPRKNWSSLILFNCAHPSNQIVDLEFVNTQPMSQLHQFRCLKDEEIGNLPYQWNYLEGWYDSHDARAVHYTRGGPWFENWRNVEYATEWLQEESNYRYSTVAIA